MSLKIFVRDHCRAAIFAKTFKTNLICNTFNWIGFQMRWWNGVAEIILWQNQINDSHTHMHDVHRMCFYYTPSSCLTHSLTLVLVESVRYPMFTFLGTNWKKIYTHNSLLLLLLLFLMVSSFCLPNEYYLSNHFETHPKNIKESALCARVIWMKQSSQLLLNTSKWNDELFILLHSKKKQRKKS